MPTTEDPRSPVGFAIGLAIGTPVGVALLVGWWLSTTVCVVVAAVALVVVALLLWKPSGRPMALGVIWGTIAGAFLLYCALAAIPPLGD